MHTWCEISANNLRHNYTLLCELAPESMIAPVVKSNAYGHGLKEVYDSLAPLKPPMLCVNYIYEAAELRTFGYQKRILLVGPSLPEELVEAHKLKVEVAIGSEGLFESWLQTGKKPEIHLEFDTGLSRQGLFLDAVEEYWQKVEPFGSLVKGVSTHFANVEDVTNQSFAEQQLDSLQLVAEVLEKKGLDFELHAAASAPTLIMSRARLDFCRVGISVYGFWPSGLTKLSYLAQNKIIVDLKPVLSWHSKIVSLRTIKAGTYVGYGCSYRTSINMKIATVSVGYFEGFPRNLSQSGAYFLCGGKRCPILGRVCMNMLMIDVSSCPSLGLGDKVTIIGQQEKEEITAENLAEWGNTIQYEIVTRINHKVPRLII